jgi:hypothetical protein
VHNPFAPLIAIAQRGILFTSSFPSAPVPAAVSAGCQPRPILVPVGSGIPLKLRHLRKGIRIVEPPDHPGDASCKKGPPDASPNLEPPSQPIEKEELATSSIINPHPDEMRHPVGVLDRSGESGPRQPHPRSRRIPQLGPETPKTVKHPGKRSNAVLRQTNTLPHSIVLPKIGESPRLTCK